MPSFLLTEGGEGGEGGREACLPPQERKRGGRSKRAKKRIRSVLRLAEVSQPHMKVQYCPGGKQNMMPLSVCVCIPVCVLLAPPPSFVVSTHQECEAFT